MIVAISHMLISNLVMLNTQAFKNTAEVFPYSENN